MIKCKLINTSGKLLHISKHTDQRYAVAASSFYYQRSIEAQNDYRDFVGVFRVDPIITPTRQNEDFIILKMHTPGISPTPGLLSLDYDMIEDLLKDWEILGVYDIFKEDPSMFNHQKNERLEIIDD